MTDAPPARKSVFRGLLAHFAWEAILFLLVAVAAVGTFLRSEPGAYFWLALATAGVTASALALSFRTATPNLAVPSIAALTAAIYAVLSREDWPSIAAGAIAILAAGVLGVFLGVVTGLTSAPGWAVSLGGIAISSAIFMSLVGTRGVIVPAVGRPGTATAIGFMAIFVIGSLAGGVLFAIRAVRRTLSANRVSEDPAHFRVKKLIGALAGFTGSSLLAAVAGLMMAVTQGGVFGNASWQPLLVAAAVVLMGGVSVFGRRGGIAGVVLATMLLAFLPMALGLEGPSEWRLFGLPAVFIFIGLVVGFALEKMGGRED